MTEELVTEDHNCLKELVEFWKEDDPNFIRAEFELSTIKQIRSGNGIRMTGQSVHITEKYIKRNGEVTTRTRKTFVSHNYCPFCGKKYP
jgi:ribosome-associated protein YbcJ (S4-like RNA binding protein)